MTFSSTRNEAKKAHRLAHAGCWYDIGTADFWHGVHAQFPLDLFRLGLPSNQGLGWEGNGEGGVRVDRVESPACPIPSF